jgi:uncharacterized protein (DUF885 family)
VRWRPSLVVAVLGCAPFLFSRSNGEHPVLSLDEAFARASLALSPSSATAQGYHEHGGRKLDELLDDLSPAGVEAQRKLYQETLQRSAKLRSPAMPLEDRSDLEIIELQCKLGLLELNDIQSYRHNPTVYVELIGNAIYSPYILNYAPERVRFSQITARIEKIPSFVAVARRNLASAPDIWNRVAQEENDGNIDLIDKTIRVKVPVDLRARYEAASGTAISALRSFNQYLRDDLSKSLSDWRLGANLYSRKFDLALATGDTPSQTLQDAQTRMAEIREDMKRQATAIYPRYFPGEAPPTDLNKVVTKVLDKIAQQHATPGGYFADAERDLRETTEFVRTKRLLALPKNNNLQVIPTPEFMRGIYGVGGFSPAPILEPRLGAFYWITPFTSNMSKERIESKLREYNRYGLEILTIHEAMPGHYVQAEYAGEITPKWRGALRALFSNNPYVEGWAVYATEMMLEQGYDNTPETRLTFGKQMLRVVANTILDVKLQTMGMTDWEAMDLMINQTFQEKEEAEKKLQRAKLSSGQLPTYFVGWRGWDRLRDAERTRLGPRFRLFDFHERALKEGGVPLPVLAELLHQ